jgi:mono/diheme cytochrome c family protein
MPRAARIFLLALLVGVVACLGDGSSRDAVSYTQSLPESGYEWFRTYCASCHGVSARGDGPVADELKTQPTNLARIAARSDGEFDALRVARYIDGRTELAVHGTREMPVWGRRFDDRTGEALVEETRLGPGPILLIVEYLRSIQETEPVD